ncbi:MAG TPA: HPF/RaiA family ribosome-associated protein [Pirellulales bacterium]|nr:HPF/RaiA family ribosome-associated protein [Pirellulales bacterium]
MQLPLQISFHNVPRTDELESLVRDVAHCLDEFAGDIMSCRVVVDMPHQHHRQGNLYQVRVDLKLRDEEIAVTREPAQHAQAADVRKAVSEAFDTAVRQVEDIVRRRRRATKTHNEVPTARVAKLFPVSAYGFLETRDGREIYFHRNSVLHDAFKNLSIGSEVRFVEEEGDKGPQASSVTLIGKPAVSDGE